jgi:intracellular sulfur oxidation DsrE/DsrF family protein
MPKTRFAFAILFAGLLASPAIAGNSVTGSNVACPVDSPYDGMSFEDQFGADVLEKMRCNKRRANVKMVMQVNTAPQANAAPEDEPKPMYGFKNLPNIIKDFEITHGVKNWEIAVVIHSGGFPYVLDPNVKFPHELAWKNDQPVAAPYPGLTGAEVVEKFIGMGVDVYFCLNTAAALGITTDQILPGVKYVPAGLSSLIDFQYDGFKYVQP